MIGDRLPVSEDFLRELVDIGLSADVIEDALENKYPQRLRQQGFVSRIPAQEAFDVFLSNVKNGSAHDVELSPSSIRTYQLILEEFNRFCKATSKSDLDVAEVLTQVVPFLTECKYRQPKLAPATVNKYIAVLRTFIHETALHYNLAEGRFPKSLPRKENLPQALSDEAAVRLLEVASSSQYGLRALFMIAFFLNTGVRRDEFRILQRRDMDLRHFSVKVSGKGSRNRVIRIPDLIHPLILHYFDTYGITEPQHFLYPRTGTLSSPVSPGTLDDTARRLFEKLPTYSTTDEQYSYHLHSLRHTYAVGLLRAGVPLRTIAQALGHKSVRTTQIYTVLDTENLRYMLQPGMNKLSEWWRGRINEGI